MTIKGKKILVTSGAGFIGSHVVDALVEKGANVKVYDNFSSGLMDHLKNVKDDVEVIKGDILNFDKLDKSIKGCDIVVHQAAQLEIAKCIENPIQDLTTNTIGSLNVFNSCVKNKVAKVVWASSAGVYGQLVKRPQKEDSHPTNPNWQYGVSKLSVEKYANIYNEMYQLPIISLRYSIVYGPREWWGRVLSIFLKKALENKSLVIFGDGDQTRDFIYVGDIVDLNLLSIGKDYDDHLVLNGSSNREVSIKELAETVKTALRKPDLKIVIDKKTKEGEMSKDIGRIRLPSELKAIKMSNDKAQRILGWEQRIQLNEGLQKEYAWLRENHRLWKKIKI